MTPAKAEQELDQIAGGTTGSAKSPGIGSEPRRPSIDYIEQENI